jgi:hypothetical protein
VVTLAAEGLAGLRAEAVGPDKPPRAPRTK